MYPTRINLLSLSMRTENWVSSVLDSGECDSESASSASYAATVLIGYINVTAQSLERSRIEGIIETLSYRGHPLYIFNFFTPQGIKFNNYTRYALPTKGGYSG